MKPRATIKSTPDDFVVEEIPAYAPTGEGPHLYVCFRKRELNTLDAIRRLADSLDVDAKQAGFAGMKDRHAVTTQWASFAFPDDRPPPSPSDLAADGIEVLEVSRHRNKLKTGHLRGNRFTVTLRDLDPSAVDDVVAALREAGRRGVPNAFGEQRFGRDGDNATQALAWLRGERRPPRGHRQKRLYVSALQSHMFNEVLKERGDAWDRMWLGDLAQKHDSGGVFLVDEEALADAEERAQRGEIAPTGPMFGVKMRWPSGEPERIERTVLEREVGSLDVFRQVAKIARGARRPLRLRVADLKVHEQVASSVLTASFVLAKGGYATTVLARVCDTRLPEPPHAP